MSREKIKIFVHRNVRLFSPLMVNSSAGVVSTFNHLASGRHRSAMMDDLTPRGQQVLALARQEAERFHHNYVGTEHLLLGLIKLGQGVAVNVLQRMGLDLEQVRILAS